jgi:hypothetical protein
MRDFYVALASEAVHRDVCSIITPDFRYTDGCIERKFVQRRARDINLNDEIRWGVNRQINLFVIPNSFGMLDVEARVWFKALEEIWTLQSR